MKLRKINANCKEWRDCLLATVNGKEKMNSTKFTASDHLKAASNYLQLGNQKKAQEEMQLYKEKCHAEEEEEKSNHVEEAHHSDKENCHDK